MLRSVKYGLYGAVLAGLVGGTVAWTNVDKTVHLVVDGRERTVHTTAADVGDVVTKAGYRITSHDLIAPSASSHVKDGATIVFKRGRLLRLDVDGADRSVWTTADTVSQALADLGFTGKDLVSVSRSRRLPLGATDIAVRTPKDVTVVHDGTSVQVSSTDATVGALLSDLSITVGQYDKLSQPATAPLTAGAVIRLTRVVHRTITATQPIAFTSTTRNDSSLAAGTTQVVTNGRKGVLQISWAAIYVDGKLVAKTRIGSTVLTKPVGQVEKVGTKQAKVAAVSTGSSGSGSSGSSGSGVGASPSEAKAIAKSLLADYGFTQDEFSCLDSMWTRESGWRVHAANGSGAYGIPQALPGSKMSSVGSDWQDDATTQIKWGLKYISSRYNSPCQAWSVWQSQGWY